MIGVTQVLAFGIVFGVGAELEFVAVGVAAVFVVEAAADIEHSRIF